MYPCLTSPNPQPVLQQGIISKDDINASVKPFNVCLFLFHVFFFIAVGMYTKILWIVDGVLFDLLSMWVFNVLHYKSFLFFSLKYTGLLSCLQPHQVSSFLWYFPHAICSAWNILSSPPFSPVDYFSLSPQHKYCIFRKFSLISYQHVHDPA
jgi:hypothetical protein